MRVLVFLASFFIFQLPFYSHAYVGPGLGLGTLGVIFGILASIFFAIIGIFFYPIKRLIRKFRTTRKK